MNTREDTAKSIIELVKYLQATEHCAAAIIPYPGGVIAFGSRESVISMLGRDDETDA